MCKFCFQRPEDDIDDDVIVIPAFVSQQLAAIIANLDEGCKSESQITHDLGEYLAMSPMVLMFAGMAKQSIPARPRKIVQAFRQTA
jgi:hypothetical protein